MKRKITFWNHSPITFTGDKEIASAPLFRNNAYQRAYVEKDSSGALHLWKYEGYGIGNGMYDPVQMRTHIYDSATREMMMDFLSKHQQGNPGQPDWIQERLSLSSDTIRFLMKQLTDKDA